MNFDELKLTGTPEIITNDFSKMLQDSYLDPAEEIKNQPVAISIGESDYKGKSYPIPFGSYGDFSCIVGASKSRKTFFKSMIEAGYIGGQSNILNPSIKGHYSSDRLVISLDTEQSKYHTQRVQRRVLDLIGGSCDLYKTFSLRSYNPKERFDFIDWLVYESEFKNDIGLMSIDGFVDLVTDFNSLEQATGLTQKLLDWTAKPNKEDYQQMHITGILHKNFGTSKPVGHVGSSVLKKAETIAMIEKDGDICTVNSEEYSRNMAFKPITFGINKDWLPYEIDNSVGETLPKNTKPAKY